MSVEIEFPVEFWLPGVPASQQASSLSQASWRARIADAARTRLPEGHFVSGDAIKVTIYHFSADRMEGDLDNIIKPILDSLNRVLYLDDSQIERIVAQRFESGGLLSFDVSSRTLATAVASEGARTYLHFDISSDGRSP